MLKFAHDIAGGQGNLIVTSVQSPNFVHGVSGWRIARDGSAEFRDIIIPAGSGGAVITFASAAPAAPNVGDIWYDTASGLLEHQWNGTTWVPFQIGAGAIANNAITTALIASGAVNTTELAAGAVTTAQIAAAAGILGAQIASGTITGTNIQAGTITAGLLAAGIVVAGIVNATTINAATFTGSVFQGTDFIINSNGEFYYSSAPAAGDLVSTISNVMGNDGHGNYFLPGYVNYVPAGGGGYVAVQVSAGAVNFWFAANMVSVSNPWSDIGNIVALNGTPNVLQLASGPNTGDYIGLASPVKVTGGFHYSGPITAYAPGGTTDETWHAVSNPTGVTGTIRVKMLAESKIAVLDVNVVITSDLGTGTSYTAGSLPSSGYYPQASRQFPVTVNQGMGASAAAPRVSIPISGAVVLQMPGFTTAGNACIVSGTIMYPLD